jgi:hypothetical protein
MPTLPIPKLYWDTFQSALQAKVKRLAKEVAATLGQSEQPLLKALSAEKVDAYLFEEEGAEMLDIQSMRCKHLLPTSENPAVLRPCLQPVVLGKTGCLHHEITSGSRAQNVPIMKSVKDMDGTTYWVDGHSVRRKEDLSCIGFYTGEKLCIFKVV